MSNVLLSTASAPSPVPAGAASLIAGQQASGCAVTLPLKCIAFFVMLCNPSRLSFAPQAVAILAFKINERQSSSSSEEKVLKQQRFDKAEQ